MVRSVPWFLISMKTIGKKPPSPHLNIDRELSKVRAHIQAVSNTLTNSDLELGTSVRLNVERREWEAYLQGILFALGEGPPLQNSLETES